MVQSCIYYSDQSSSINNRISKYYNEVSALCHAVRRLFMVLIFFSCPAYDTQQHSVNYQSLFDEANRKFHIRYENQMNNRVYLHHKLFHSHCLTRLIIFIYKDKIQHRDTLIKWKKNKCSYSTLSLIELFPQKVSIHMQCYTIFLNTYIQDRKQCCMYN